MVRNDQQKKKNNNSLKQCILTITKCLLNCQWGRKRSAESNVISNIMSYMWEKNVLKGLAASDIYKEVLIFLSFFFF